MLMYVPNGDGIMMIVVLELVKVDTFADYLLLFNEAIFDLQVAFCLAF